MSCILFCIRRRPPLKMGKVNAYGQLATRIYTLLIDPLLAPVHSQVAKICQRLKCQDVFDIASATGAQCLLLDRAGINAVGLDLSKAMIATAARRSPPTVRTCTGRCLISLSPTDSSIASFCSWLFMNTRKVNACGCCTRQDGFFAQKGH